MFKHTYLRNRFFYVFAIAVAFFILGFSFTVLFTIGQVVLVLLFLVSGIDWYLLYQATQRIKVSRNVNEKLSLGDSQSVHYKLDNQSNRNLLFELIDEFPEQLQFRSTQKSGSMDAQDELYVETEIRPLIRGEYNFGETHVYISTPMLRLLERKVSMQNETMIKVVPSIIQMRKYALEVFAKTATMAGIRKVRTIGENDEFEQIRQYQQGDNFKSINWKASSRKNELMINQYQNTRSQSVYCIVDKGRSMKMPFNGLTLLDYAINTSLVISNIVLKKYDKAGLITFSEKIGQVVKSENTPKQLSVLSEQLYNQKTGFKESNHELLFYYLRQHLKRRSILLYFTNFENVYDLEKNIDYLKSLNRRHLMIIIFFDNTELQSAKDQPIESISDVYVNTFAAKAIMEKEQIRDQLRVNGIQTILTAPENLSVNVINKYLEIKAKRMK